MRDTKYASEINSATDSLGQTIERLFVKEHMREEIRFSWWKDGRLIVRPLDLPEAELLPLMKAAIDKDVFSKNFLLDLQVVLANYFARSDRENGPAEKTASEKIGHEIERPDDPGLPQAPMVRRRMTIEQMMALGRDIAAMPLLDDRSPDEIADDVDPL